MDRTAWKLRSFNRRRARFGEDLCDLLGPTFVDGGATGDSVTTATIALNVPCMYESSGVGSQIVVGGEAYTASHRITMPNTAVTEAITPKYKIKVLARGNTAELIFEDPVIVQKSYKALLTVAANLVQQGFQQ